MNEIWKIDMSTKGFTLMEVLVSVAVLGVLIVSATSLLLSSIKGGGKSEVETLVKQNGQVALNTIEQKVRNAQRVVPCVSSELKSINLVDLNNEDLSIACKNVGESTGRITLNDSRLTSDKVEVVSCSFSCDEDAGQLRGPFVKINFALKQAGIEGVGSSAQVDFSTSVYVRSVN